MLQFLSVYIKLIGNYFVIHTFLRAFNHEKQVFYLLNGK